MSPFSTRLALSIVVGFFVVGQLCDLTFCEEIVQPVVGEFNFSDVSFEIAGPSAGGEPWTPGAPCIEYGILGPVVLFYGRIRGDVRGSLDNLAAVIDGVRLNGTTLPTAAFFKYGMDNRGLAFCSCCYNCGVWPPCQSQWTIGEVSGSFGYTGGIMFFETPAAKTVGGLPFYFIFCTDHIIWGAGCGIIGSPAYAWELHIPAPLRAVTIPSGNPPPHEFAGTGLTIDIGSSGGGILTATSVPGPPPFSPPALELLPRYWEVRTDIPESGMVGSMSIAYDPAEIPQGVAEAELHLWRYEPDCGTWEGIPAIVDLVTHTITADALKGFGIHVVGADAGSPFGSPHLTADLAGLSWRPLVTATAYDVVRGDLGNLLASGGDFSVATEECVAANLNDTLISTPVNPSQGSGFWFLVRGRNSSGAGTYDSLCNSQVSSRDAGVNGSGMACP